jgi:hypothetical protein
MRKLLLILLCVPLIGFGQTWEKTFGWSGVNNEDYNEKGRSVQQTTDGGFIITGVELYTEDMPPYEDYSDVYLIKTDSSGIEQWNKRFGESWYNDGGYSVQQTTDGGYIISGETRSFGNGSSDVYLIKTDANGIEQWNQTFGGVSTDGGYSVQQTTDGGYIITGYTWSFGNGSADVYLIKIDANGIEQWNQTFGGTSSDYGYSVQQTTDGGYIISAETRSFGNLGSTDVYLIKTDGNGTEQWYQTFGGTDDDYGTSVQQTTDGGYIITGGADSYPPDVYLIKTDANGIEQWNQTFGGVSTDVGRSVQQTTDGGYIITGYTWSFGNGSADVYLIKTDVNGIEQWNQTFGGPDADGGYSVQQTTDGGYIIAGYAESFGNGDDEDLYLIKTDGDGNVTSELTIPINSNRELEKVVDVLGRDINPEKYKPFIEIYNDGTVEKKIIVE